jgi:hypothetical protein
MHVRLNPDNAARVKSDMERDDRSANKIVNRALDIFYASQPKPLAESSSTAKPTARKK